MRGTQFEQLAKLVDTGIIPAYAGNTVEPYCRFGSVQDHPRVCGEHIYSCFKNGDIEGSSPRMRGTRSVQPRWGFRSGIIPAYAGNTSY